MHLVDEASLIEQESGQIGAIQLTNLVQLHVQALRSEGDLLVGEPIDRVFEEAFESGLVTTNGQVWVQH